MRHRAMLIVIAAALASGCARTTIDHSIPTDYPRTDDTAALDFWHDLSQRAAITNDEGLHGVLVLMAGNDPTTSYEGRLDLLREEGWIPQSFNEAPNLAMQRGTLSKAIVEALGIEGGVMYSVTGARRYADRELVALNVMPPGTELQAISGADFLGIITRAQGYAMLKGVELGNKSFADTPTALDPAPIAPTPAEPQPTPSPRPTRDGDIEWTTIPAGDAPR